MGVEIVTMNWGAKSHSNIKKWPRWVWAILLLVYLYALLSMIMRPSSAFQEPEYIVHIVQPGDTLWSVAKERQEEAGFSGDIRSLVWEIQEASETTALILPGDILLIPVVK